MVVMMRSSILLQLLKTHQAIIIIYGDNSYHGGSNLYNKDGNYYHRYGNHLYFQSIKQLSLSLLIKYNK